MSLFPEFFGRLLPNTNDLHSFESQWRSCRRHLFWIQRWSNLHSDEASVLRGQSPDDSSVASHHARLHEAAAEVQRKDKEKLKERILLEVYPPMKEITTVKKKSPINYSLNTQNILWFYFVVSQISSIAAKNDYETLNVRTYRTTKWTLIFLICNGNSNRFFLWEKTI